MSLPPGPFLVFIYDGGNKNHILITFPSRSSADEYWRRCQELQDMQPGIFVQCRRFQPHYFSIPSYWGKNPQAQEIELRSVYQSFRGGGTREGRIVPLPVQEQRPDNVNGGTFYIRSVVQPNSFWHYRTSTKDVGISNVVKTKFTIRRKTPLPFSCLPEEDILIGEDDINILVPVPEWEQPEGGNSPDVMIVKDSRSLLVAATALSLGKDGHVPPEKVIEAGVFKFGMFDGGFGVWNGQPWESKSAFASSRVDGGERWEFVR